MWQRLREDIQCVFERDPAARSVPEVLTSYPGLHAVWLHRVSHTLWQRGLLWPARLLSHVGRGLTGIEIHPAARLGRRVFIDHGMGVVIGETTEIGDHVKLYQGVTLGARSFSLDAQGQPVKHVKRHPTVEDDVVIYAHATILGGDTVIGRGSTIGANVFLMESVPPKSFVTSKHAELHIKRGNEKT